jgi:acetyltransferase-like isoleucine patch superfamily enzyme
MTGNSNKRPGRSALVIKIRGAANAIRTWLYFTIRAPWVVRKGMVRIPWSVDLWAPNNDIQLGERVQFGANCLVHCAVEFGDSVLIARNVAFIGRDDHRYDVVGETIWDSPRGDSYKTVVEDDVWFGHGVIVLAGVKIGRGSIIAAGSLIVKDVERYAIVGGVPAKMLRKRFTDEQIRRHEKILEYT